MVIQFPLNMFSSCNQPDVILSYLSEYDEISSFRDTLCVYVCVCSCVSLCCSLLQALGTILGLKLPVVFTFVLWQSLNLRANVCAPLCVCSSLYWFFRHTAQGSNPWLLKHVLTYSKKSYRSSFSKLRAWERTRAAEFPVSPLRYLLDSRGFSALSQSLSYLLGSVGKTYCREKEFYKQRIQNKLPTAR